MSDVLDPLVFATVIGARFFVPLLIPRFPLPAIIASLVLDAVDQTIFDTFTTRELENYQSYDKALDVYYLTIAYISTLRNWPAGPAFEVSRMLWYYRLVGVLLFELTGLRAILLIFPNTFEYYFIFVELVRQRWNLSRLTWGPAIGAAAGIWVGIKLPQEYWIHVAQLDVTDTLRAYPWLLVPIGLVALGGWLAAPAVARRLPPRDHGVDLYLEAGPGYGAAVLPAGRSRAEHIVRSALVEKILLVSVVSVIFAQMLPVLDATPGQVAGAVGFVVLTNALIADSLARRGTPWFRWRIEFATMAAINLGTAIVYIYLLQRQGGEIDLWLLVFFILLLTVIVVPFDRYHLERSQPEARPIEVPNPRGPAPAAS